jgi:CDP-diacylglycerol--glycerol-3-phosphate 3-phosphatidyltransferase
MGKSDRALVFGALGLWIGAGNTIVPLVASWIPPFLSLLLAATIVNRVTKGIKEHA